MSIAELEVMINVASDWAERRFAEVGGINPFWHAVTRQDEHVLFPIPGELTKDESAMIARMLFEAHGVKCCCFVTEAWTVHARDSQMAELRAWIDAHDGSIADYPSRVEVVGFAAEDKDGNMLTAERKIERDGSAVALGPLTINRGILSSEGRLVGMLSPEGRAN